MARKDASKNQGTKTGTTSVTSTAAVETSVSSGASAASAALISSTGSIGAAFKNGMASYVKTTHPLLKILDIYMAFILVTGVVQFIYVLVAGSYPFNAFLAGFSTSVGAFVLTANLRSQINPVNNVDPSSTETIKLDETEFTNYTIVPDGKKTVTPRRAYFDYIFANILLFSFAVNYLG